MGITSKHRQAKRHKQHQVRCPNGHRRRLFELFRQKFGEHIPLIRREDVKGFIKRKPIWMNRPLGLEAVRKQACLTLHCGQGAQPDCGAGCDCVGGGSRG